jgi:hypothetical protein
VDIYSDFELLLQNMHGGYPEATLVRFLKARDDNVPKASKMVKPLYSLPFLSSIKMSHDVSKI